MAQITLRITVDSHEGSLDYESPVDFRNSDTDEIIAGVLTQFISVMGSVVSRLQQDNDA